MKTGSALKLVARFSEGLNACHRNTPGAHLTARRLGDLLLKAMARAGL